MKLLLATRSVHKAAEVRRILGAFPWGTGVQRADEPAPGAPPGAGRGDDVYADPGISVAGRGVCLVTPEEMGIPASEEEEVLECFTTFEENAAAKARYFGRKCGLPTVADDSGLEVDALGGRPGVHTKRFAPPGVYPELSRNEANNRHLVALLSGLSPARRRARYVCVATCFLPWAPDSLAHFRGEASGWILVAARGTGGFGYDPLFFDDETGRSYAELSSIEKDLRSHRGKAFRALARFLAVPGRLPAAQRKGPAAAE